MSDETQEEYNRFLFIMLETWTADEMAYLHHKVIHPSYGQEEESS